MFGGMKTVELLCPDPGGFKIAVRTNAVNKSNADFFNNNAYLNIANSTSSNEIKDQNSVAGGPNNAVEKYLAMARSVQKGRVLSHDDVVLKVASAKIERAIFQSQRCCWPESEKN